MEVGSKYDCIDDYRTQYTLTVLSFTDKVVLFEYELRNEDSKPTEITVTIEKLNELIKKNYIQLMD